GRVRDLLLEKGNGDVDLVVEGDASTIARELSRQQGGKVVDHPSFGTATYLHGDLRIDLATARSEVYSRPGALPLVGSGSMETDLSRRDFTINAMALRLSPPQVGQLLDPHDGQSDLEKGLVRVLHSGSFADDATRIMRAIRYEQRLGFRLEEGTLELLVRDLPYLESVGVDRLRHELELILQEDSSERALLRANELGVLKQISPALSADDWLAETYQRARSEVGSTGSGLYLALLLYRTTPEDALGFLRRYRFAREQIQTVEDLMKLKSQHGSLEKDELQPSAIYALLEGLSVDTLHAFQIASDSPLVEERVQLYLSDLRPVKSCLNGGDLLALGVPRGPGMGRLLEELLKARLDRKVTSKEDEIAFVKRSLQK
ncbi:MAG: CCA tRNA nucleotidyltransferase, partial [Dehalococcoidia bacterium]